MTAPDSIGLFGLQLTDAERQSALWMKLARHVEQRLDILRRRNDNQLDDLATAKLRGQIAECKAILALGNPAPTVVTTDQ